uniref:Solute carrier family 40 member n=1 Tax=Acrobeloides nanus TaxID=290746 RepID=A0A914D0S3_9BILA
VQLPCLILALASIWLPGSPFDPITYFKDTTFSSWWNTFLDTFRVTSGVKENVSNSGVDWSDFTVAGRSAASLFSLYIGIALSRYGLWVADLAITQIMQESVAETERGTVFGVENSLCMFFSVGKDLLAIMLPDPKTFGLLILFSFGTVFGGFLQYIYYCLKSKIKAKEEVSNNKPKESSQDASLCEISFL